MIEVPLQTIDNVLLNFHMGHVLVAVFVLAVLSALPLRSRRVLGLNIVLAGALFMLVPISMTGDSGVYRLAGVGLLIIGPMIYMAGE
ncbi:hypothetical protein ACFOZ7_10405 [Natribaculum luteum]|uniref:DUF8006 domain-containing protein n=1 Tax=Natribaculum luteum TaxID=1586232 RepID=A0ABD5NZI1_9EURY|nr:hypothetical protein [Natribaculum luteum]